MIAADRELLSVWEEARSSHPALRPAALLRRMAGEADAERLPVGVRDRRLLALREAWRGAAYEAVADCDACGTRVELTFAPPPPSVPSEAPRAIDVDGIEVEYRLPDSVDLRAAAGCADVESARVLLATRCAVRARSEDGEVPLPPLDEALIVRMEEAMAAADPDGDLRLCAVCPECGGEFEVIFDPALFIWNEVESAAIEALRAVDALASAYGWSEDEILSLSPARRQAYLGMVLS